MRILRFLFLVSFFLLCLVLLKNNSIAVVCQNITSACMDKVAFFLDESVVKDWVQPSFWSILDSLETNELDKLLECPKQVAGICSVLEATESAIKGSVSPQFLREHNGKTQQHMYIMVWCRRHRFLEDARSRNSNFTSWNALVRQRKSNAIIHASPDAIDHSSDCNVQGASLFIEDAVENLEREPEYCQETGSDLGVGCLQNDERSFLRSKIEGTSGSYPFENLRTAADILFLHCSSDLVVAKQAMFFYYLFDWRRTTPKKYWKRIIDGLAANIGRTGHSYSLLESFVSLLDDHSQDKAIDILPAFGQQQVRFGQFSEMEDTSERSRNSDLPDAVQMITSSVPFPTNSVVLQRASNDASTRETVENNGTPIQLSHLIGRLCTSINRGQKSEVRSRNKTLEFGEVSTPLKDPNRAHGNSQLKGSPETNVDRFMENSMSSPYLHRVTANNPEIAKTSRNYLIGSAQKPESRFFGTRMQPNKELSSSQVETGKDVDEDSSTDSCGASS